MALFLSNRTGELGSVSSTSCPFCNDEIVSSQLIFEGDKARAILTYKPAVDGHVLIVPKRHVARFELLDASEILEISELVSKVNRAVQKTFKTTGYLLIQKNGEEVGQSVFHVHFHYLPNTKGKSLAILTMKWFLSPWLPQLSQTKMREVAQNLEKNAL